MFIINSIVPIFLLIALGKTLRITGFFPEAFFKGLNRLVYWFALPALLISNISSAPLELATLSQIVLLFTTATLLTLLVGWLVARLLKLPPRSAGAFIQGAFRGNGAFIGLPIIIYTLGTIDPKAETLGTLILAPVVIIFNMLGVTVLQHYGTKENNTGRSIAHFFGQMIRNPLIMACLIGLALNLSGLNLPLLLTRPIRALGGAALPLILLSIGSALIIEKPQGAASPSLIASLIKVTVAPTFGFLLAGLFPLDTTERMIAVFYLGCPAAGMSYVMAEVMGNDAKLAGRIIALSTLLSAVTLPIIIAIGL